MKVVVFFILSLISFFSDASDLIDVEQMGKEFVFCSGTDCSQRSVKFIDDDRDDAVKKIGGFKRVGLVDKGGYRLLSVYFELGSSELSSFEVSKLSLFVSKRKHGRIELAGYTDKVGSLSFNKRLAELRANAVRKKLIDFGVVASDMYLVSKCCIEWPPVVNEKARRVDIRVLGD